MNIPVRNNFYVYALLRSDGVPFYIGKGTGRRMQNHISESRRGRTRKDRFIRALVSRGAKFHKIKISTKLTEDQAFAVEKDYISAIGRSPIGTLVNCTDGGEGLVNMPPESREASRAALIRKNQSPEHRISTSKQFKDKKQSPEHIANRSAALKVRFSDSALRMAISVRMSGRKLSDATKEKLRLVNIGKKQSPELIERRIAPLRGRKYARNK